jgi:hypothetical protein
VTAIHSGKILHFLYLLLLWFLTMGRLPREIPRFAHDDEGNLSASGTEAPEKITGLKTGRYVKQIRLLPCATLLLRSQIRYTHVALCQNTRHWAD